MRVKLTVPTSKQQVPLYQYQEFDKVQELNKEGEDGTFVLEKMVSIFCEIEMSQLRNIQYDQFEVICAELSKAFEGKSKHRQIIAIDGQEFGMIPNFDEMTFGEYVDLDEYSKNVADYHKFMAVLYRPITAKSGDAYEIEPYKGSQHLSDIMKHASLSDLEGALLFFWTLANELFDLTSRYLQEGLMRTSTEQGHSSEGSTDGISPSLRSQVMTLLKSAQLQSATFMSACSNYNLIKSVWTSNKKSLKQRETRIDDEAVL